MYLQQIVAAYSGSKKGCVGALERDVVRAMMVTSGASEGLAQYEIDRAVKNGTLRLEWCRCK